MLYIGIDQWGPYIVVVQEAQGPLVNSIRSAMQRNDWWLNRCVSIGLQNTCVRTLDTWHLALRTHDKCPADI